MRLDLWSRRALLGILVFALCGGIAAYGGQSGSQSNFGSSFFFVNEPCPARQFPTFESLVPVPAIIDPFEQDTIPGFCELFAEDDTGPRKGVKGKFETELIVIDHISGMAKSFPIKKGTERTDRSGRASFDFELPAELFADGFESGDVSAWSYTRSDFKGTKKVQQGGISCGVGASKSSD